MKKLLIVVFLAGFVGLGFAFSPSTAVSSKEMNKTDMFNDSTKTKKKTTTTTTSTTKTTKKDCSSKTGKSCCNKPCSGEKPKK